MNNEKQSTTKAKFHGQWIVIFSKLTGLLAS